MSKLKSLYEAVDTFKKLGLKLNDEQIDEISKLEEEIISTEIIPIIDMNIAPILQQIQREITIEINYVPNEPLTVSLVRQQGLDDEINEGIEKESLEQVRDRRTFTMASHTKGPKTGLKVTFPDGKVFQERFAYQTLLEAVKTIEHERIESLKIVANHVPLISSSKDEFYKQHPLAKGVLVMTQTSTKVEKAQLDEISKSLGLNLKVEIV